jgi:hypothetical protein
MNIGMIIWLGSMWILIGIIVDEIPFLKGTPFSEYGDTNEYSKRNCNSPKLLKSMRVILWPLVLIANILFTIFFLILYKIILLTSNEKNKKDTLFFKSWREE